MRQHFTGNIQIVTRQKDFGHYIALVTKIFEVVFGAQIVEAIEKSKSLNLFIELPTTIKDLHLKGQSVRGT
jgi:hypothetical protein